MNDPEYYTVFLKSPDDAMYRVYEHCVVSYDPPVEPSIVAITMCYVAPPFGVENENCVVQFRSPDNFLFPFIHGCVSQPTKEILFGIDRLFIDRNCILSFHWYGNPALPLNKGYTLHGRYFESANLAEIMCFYQ